MENKFSNSQGFTLIEMIIVVGIVLFFSGFGVAKYNDYNQQLILKNQARKIADVIEFAKKKATSADLSQQNCDLFQGYRVAVSPEFYYLRIKCNDVYVTLHTYRMTTNIGSTTGDESIDFLPLGNTNRTSQLQFTLENTKIAKCINVTVSPVGIVTIDDIVGDCP